MSIFFLSLYMLLWVLGICASYAFVMTATKKDASISFLRASSLVALLSYGVSWFFGVLYYIQPDIMLRFTRAVPLGSNAWLASFFAQSRECLFLSFVFVPVLATVLAVMVWSDDCVKKKKALAAISMILSGIGVFVILTAMMIV